MPNPLKPLLVTLHSVISRVWLWRATRVGSKPRVRGCVMIENRGTLELGDNVKIWSHVARTLLTTGPGATLKIGNDSFVNFGTTIAARNRVEIGNRVQIANFVTIMDSDFHGVEDRDKTPPAEPVIIEDDAWIAVKSTILKGVRIGARSVVAAGSVVTKSVPPDTLVGGVPAKVIRSLAPPGASGSGS